MEHFHPILAVASGQEIKDELTPGGGVSFNLMRCIVRALVVKDNKMYKGWLDRWRGLFDPRFVVLTILKKRKLMQLRLNAEKRRF